MVVIVEQDGVFIILLDLFSMSHIEVPICISAFNQFLSQYNDGDKFSHRMKAEDASS